MAFFCGDFGHAKTLVWLSRNGPRRASIISTGNHRQVSEFSPKLRSFILTRPSRSLALLSAPDLPRSSVQVQFSSVNVSCLWLFEKWNFSLNHLICFSWCEKKKKPPSTLWGSKALTRMKKVSGKRAEFSVNRSFDGYQPSCAGGSGNLCLFKAIVVTQGLRVVACWGWGGGDGGQMQGCIIGRM